MSSKILRITNFLIFKPFYYEVKHKGVPVHTHTHTHTADSQLVRGKHWLHSMSKFGFFLLTLFSLITVGCTNDSRLERETQNDSIEVDFTSMTTDDISSKILENFPLNQELSDGSMIVGLSLEDPTTAVACVPEIPSNLGGCISNFNVNLIVNLPAKVFPSPIGVRPACSMPVQVNVTACQDQSGNWHFYFYNLRVDWTACPSFVTWFVSLPDNEKSAMQDQWEFDASVIVEIVYINNFLTLLNVPTCNLGTSVFSSQFTFQICSSKCLIPSRDEPFFDIYEYYCGSQCCIRSTSGCRSFSGTILLQGGYSYATKGDACEKDPTICPPNSTPLTSSCYAECGPPNF